jgi:hypothetical protein
MDDKALNDHLKMLYRGLRDQRRFFLELQRSVDALVEAIQHQNPEATARYEAELETLENAASSEDEDLLLFGINDRIGQLEGLKKP